MTLKDFKKYLVMMRYCDTIVIANDKVFVSYPRKRIKGMLSIKLFNTDKNLKRGF